jgi:hypothetical protein
MFIIAMLYRSSRVRPQPEPGWPWRPSLGLLLVLLLPVQTPAGADEASDNCQRCHGMATLGYRDPITREIVDLHVDADAFAASDHGEMACVDCHDRDYRTYPHSLTVADEELDCVGCHRNDKEPRASEFKRIDEEFLRSVHAQPAPADDPTSTLPLDCHDCHDPHSFRAARPGDDIAAIVSGNNAVCLSCHQDVGDPLAQPHAWLPNPDRHWQAVRCIDCHAPATDHRSHDVLPAEDANRDCVNCHSRDATLLNQLYSYRSETDLAEQGLIAKAVYNEAYIVGMSRSPTIDAIGLGVIALMLAGIAAHAFGRWRVSRKGGDDHA